MKDELKFSNIDASTSDFYLKGGKYGVTAVATWGGGSVTFEKLSLDGSTYVPVVTAFSDDSFVTVDLPAGKYRVAVATATGAYVEIKSVP